jgi:hypothetical protein
MACREWGMPMREVIDVFEQHDVLGYIERNFGLLHMEGDDAVFDDVTCYLRSKGVVVL